MSRIRVTVLMPVRDAGKYIAEAIQSVLDQTFTDFELLIVNDGSTDNTVSLIKQFRDPRIRILEQPGLGIAIALNYGLKEAKGEYIARFDGDDICFPERLQKQVDFLDQHPDYILAGCDAEYVDEKGEHLFNFYCIGHTHEEIMDQLYVYCPFIHSAVMYRKNALMKTNGYSPDAHNFEDYLLWVDLAKYGRYYNVPDQLIKVRFNPESATIDEKWRGRHFRRLKRNIILRGSVTEEEGRKLQAIIDRQNVQMIKKGAYHALCGKKFLVNNYQPAKSRAHLSRAIRYHPMRFDNYALYLMSFLPRNFINWLYRKKNNRIGYTLKVPGKNAAA